MARSDAITECFVCRKHREQGPLLPGGPVGLSSATGRPGLAVWPCLSRASPGRAPPACPRPGRFDRCGSTSSGLVVLPGQPGTARSRGRRARVCGRHRRSGAPPACSPAARYPGTPREYSWNRVDEWPETRRGGESQIAALVRGLHEYLRAAADVRPSILANRPQPGTNSSVKPPSRGRGNAGSSFQGRKC